MVPLRFTSLRSHRLAIRRPRSLAPVIPENAELNNPLMNAANLCAMTMLLLLSLASSPAIAQQTASAHADHLLHADRSWNGKPYARYPSGPPTLSMIRLTIPPHTALPWHIHPVPNAGYVLEGELTIQDKASGASHVFHQGEAFAESVDDAHRGVSGDRRTVLILTYADGNNLPTSIPLKGERNEY